METIAHHEPAHLADCVALYQYVTAYEAKEISSEAFWNFLERLYENEHKKMASPEIESRGHHKHRSSSSE